MEEKQIPQDEKLQLNVTVWSPLQTEMNRETMQYAQYIIFSSGAQDSPTTAKDLTLLRTLG